MKAIKAREVERALGGHLQCGSPQFTGPSASRRRPMAGQSGRAYNSASNWPGAWYRESNFRDVVPKLLSAKAFTYLVLLSPTSDLTNLKEVEEQHHEGLAQQSALNMFQTTLKALESSPSLRKVVIFEMFPRCDSPHLSSLAITYNIALKELVAASPHTQQITVVGHPSLTVRAQAKGEAMFGLPSYPSTDGIHYRGAEGRQGLTFSIIEGLKAAVVTSSAQPEGWMVQGRQGAATSPAPAATYSQVTTGNRFAVLNY